MFRLLFALLLIVVMALGAVFANLNPGSVTLNLFFIQMQWPLSVIIGLALLVGTLLGGLVSMGMAFRMRRRVSAMSRRAVLAEQELNNLRSMPIKDA